MRPMNRMMVNVVRHNPCHRHRKLLITRHYNVGTSMPTKRGTLYSDRDYHIHLGGAIPSSLIADWINSGQLSLDDAIPDLVALSSSSSNSSDVGNDPQITVRQAILKKDSQYVAPLS